MYKSYSTTIFKATKAVVKMQTSSSRLLERTTRQKKLVLLFLSLSRRRQSTLRQPTSLTISRTRRGMTKDRHIAVRHTTLPDLTVTERARASIHPRASCIQSPATRNSRLYVRRPRLCPMSTIRIRAQDDKSESPAAKLSTPAGVTS